MSTHRTEGWVVPRGCRISNHVRRRSTWVGPVARTRWGKEESIETSILRGMRSFEDRTQKLKWFAHNGLWGCVDSLEEDRLQSVNGLCWGQQAAFAFQDTKSFQQFVCFAYSCNISAFFLRSVHSHPRPGTVFLLTISSWLSSAPLLECRDIFP